MLFQLMRIYCEYTKERSLEEKETVSITIQPGPGELGYHNGNNITSAVCLLHHPNNSRLLLLPIPVLSHSVTIFIAAAPANNSETALSHQVSHSVSKKSLC